MSHPTPSTTPAMRNQHIFRLACAGRGFAPTQELFLLWQEARDQMREELFRNLIQVERTSDQSVKLVFTSCHQATVFQNLAGVAE